MKNASLLIALLAGSFAAQAHITLEQKDAPAGSPYKAVFKVGHGCEGSATRQIVVSIPAGFRGTRPTPKAGWTLVHSATEVSWTARSEADLLQDDWYDEFVLRGTLPDQPGELAFKVRQVCVKGEANWAEVPASGADWHALKLPAPHVTLTNKLSAMPAEHDMANMPGMNH